MSDTPNVIRASVRRLLAVSAAAAIPLVAMPGLVHAQQPGARALEEIVVTARRAEETLQEVPLSISAFTAQDIEDAGLRSVEDLALQTPGFSFRSAFGRTGDRPVIRGQSNILGEPNASFFIDGVFVSGSISGYDLDNLERVEVIRGPQSALFGRRTFAGAINYITRQPTNELEGQANATVGARGLFETGLSLRGPIIDDQLLFQVNARYFERDGHYTNDVTGQRDVGGQESRSVGGTLYWLPTDNFEARLRFNWTRNDDEHFPIVRIGSALNNCFLPNIVAPPFTAETRTRGYFCGSAPRPDTVAINTDGFEAAGWSAGLIREAFRYSLVLDWTLADYQLTSVTAYNENTIFSAVDQDYSGIRGFGGAFETLTYTKDAKDYSQELRIMSPRDERFRWLGGVYYYKEKPGNQFTGNLAGTIGTGVQATLTPQATGVELENNAVFGMVEFDVTDQFTLTAEARYARDKLSLDGQSNFVLNNAAEPGSDSCVTTPTEAGTFNLVCTNAFSFNETFSNFLPRLTATYLLNEDVTLYGLWARGNKPGGINSSVENAQTVPQRRAELAQLGLRQFDEEEADTFELGVKTTFAEGRGLFNVALYYIDWSNQQLTETQAVDREGGGQFITSYIANLGKSEVKGLEAEFRYVLNDFWTVRAAYAYQDAEIKEYFSSDQADLFFPGPYTNPCDGPCEAAWRAAGDTSGNRLPLVPRHQASLSATFRLGTDNLIAGSEYFFRMDYSYEGTRYAQVHNLIDTGSANIWNFRTGFDAENWTFSVFVNNAFNDNTPAGVLRYVNPAAFINVPAQPPLPGRQTTNVRDFAITPPLKRQVGASLVYRF